MNSLLRLFEPVEKESDSRNSLMNLFLEAQPVDGDGPPHRVTEPGFDRHSVFWAMRNLPAREATKHFLACGASGAGKTTAIQLFLQSIAPRFRKESEIAEQLIIFDAKCEFIPFLAGLGLRPEDENVWILNPYDRRSCVWNLGDAISSPLMARHLATLLVPEEKSSTAPYFSNSARELVYATILGLNQIKGTGWSFRDLLCALESAEHVTAVTRHHPRAARLVARITNDHQHAGGVISHLGSRLGAFEQVAALWHSIESPREFSISSFLQKPGVLVLGNDPLLRDSLWPISAMLLKSLTHEILRRPNTLEPRHWFVFDEFPAMGKVDCLPELLTRGRSKGASVMLGVQGIEGPTEVYGENVANDLFSQCGHKTFFRAGGPKTAEWIERYFGKVRHRETTVSNTSGSSGSSQTVQHSLQERSLFLASYFLDLPFPVSGGPYVSVNSVPSIPETLISQRPFDLVLSWRTPPDETVPSVEPKDDLKDQNLLPWTTEEERLFCGDPAAEQSQDKSATRMPRDRHSET